MVLCVIMFSYFMLCFFLTKFTIYSGLGALGNNCRLEQKGGIRTHFLGGGKLFPGRAVIGCQLKAAPFVVLPELVINARF